ncbi:hypothetical protein [Haloarcula argentinensis]|uniref:MarR family transcriptional regulator n=1 Tax=Haloarcula argentinensis TaxID=43776 RepID=A0A847UQ62_HALAR|nr:hypothetical protein [Haloarcula argentinensis]NLV14350.1 hypothetical protein [Haloarcula argentinensis]
MSETARTGASEATDGVADISDTDDATVRDRVWDATLVLIRQRPLPFQMWRIRKRAGLGQEHDRTIRRTLAVMAEAGWLDHEHNSPWWYPGERADEMFES